MVREFAVFLAVVVLLVPAYAWAEDATIDIHANQPATAVNPLLLGIWRDRCDWVGLSAELVRHGDFREVNGDGLVGWTLSDGGSGATLALDGTQPIGLMNLKSAMIQVPSDGNKRKPPIALENSGGIGVKKGVVYHLRFYARCSDDFDGSLVVNLLGHDDTVLAGSEIGTPTGDWRKYTADLKATADDSGARLNISTNSVGALWVNFVSLVPADAVGREADKNLKKILADHQPESIVPIEQNADSKVIATVGKRGKDLIITLVNTTDEPIKTKFKIDGDVENSGEAITVGSVGDAEMKAVDRPGKDGPVKSVLNNVSANFEYPAAGHSLTILTLKTK